MTITITITIGIGRLFTAAHEAAVAAAVPAERLNLTLGRRLKHGPTVAGFLMGVCKTVGNCSTSIPTISAPLAETIWSAWSLVAFRATTSLVTWDGGASRSHNVLRSRIKKLGSPSAALLLARAQCVGPEVRPLALASQLLAMSIAWGSGGAIWTVAASTLQL
ncbi:hypothetical protein MMYC01_206290 [Madurella mycetomatis]|uniref:Uncharacterized protein n=1 Tax=Madurella mycetomatis TaxID=100816 RepID=A0A175W6S3_9PEZI|nr:hypothetical protein MMYC01_206290 [Madurella mycetomatis]